MKRTMTLAAALLAAATVVPATASMATAAEETTCDGVVTAQKFTGTVRVPDGGSCVIQSSTITGNVIVGADADLVLTSSTVTGVVRQEPRSFVTATKSTLGVLGAARGYGAQLSDSTVKGVLSSFARNEAPGANPAVYLVRSSAGDLRGEQLTLTAQASRIGSLAITNAVDDIILEGSTVGATAIDFTDSVALCANTFTGPVGFYYASNLTSGSADASCAGNRYRDSLSVRVATGSVAYYGNTVDGAANAQGVTALNQGRNTFKGPVSGQFSTGAAQARIQARIQANKTNRSWGPAAKSTTGTKSSLVKRATGKKVVSPQRKEISARGVALDARAKNAVTQARAKGSIRL